MKCCFCAAMAATLGAVAAPVEVSNLPPWTFADTEVSTNLAFRVDRSPVEDFAFALTLSATPSNNVQIAFGRDADADGALGVRECALAVGWDCGAWVMRRPTAEDLLLPSATTNAVKTLAVVVHVSDGRARRLSCKEDGVPVAWEFPGGDAPEWLFDPSWNMLRATVRGVDAANESICAQVTVDGTRIILR